MTFAFGTLWNKFAPLHGYAEDILNSVFENYEKHHEELIRALLLLVQMVLNLSAKFPSSNSVTFSRLEYIVLTGKERFYEEYTIENNY